MTDAIEALLAGPNHAVLGVNRADGSPQLTVVWYVWDGETFRFSTTRDRAKYRNISRDPRVSLLVNDPEGAWYVVAYGTAHIVETNHDELAQPILEKYMTPEQRERHRWDPTRVIVVLRPDRILTGR